MISCDLDVTSPALLLIVLLTVLNDRDALLHKLFAYFIRYSCQRISVSAESFISEIIAWYIFKDRGDNYVYCFL